MPARERRSKETSHKTNASSSRLGEWRYKISFLQFVSPQEWPQEYKDVFRDIDNIKQIGLEQFTLCQTNDRQRESTIVRTRERVFEVVNIASRTYEVSPNELTLRLRMEPIVFKRFAYEVDCHKCLSRYGIGPHLTDSTADTVSCRCLFNASLQGISTGVGHSFTFSDRCSTRFHNASDDEIPDHPIPIREPDKVIGLNVTGMIKDYIQKLPAHTIHTPFSGADDVVYPFFVSEAKPGTLSTGFRGIDSQTAFPLRSCLLLQKRLYDASDMEVKPLVWYMPYQEHVWSLAACVLHEDEVRVYSLWMGTPRDPDGALQLLRIVDYIVAWARDTFRETILTSLERCWKELQRTRLPNVESHDSPADPLLPNADTFCPISIEEEQPQTFEIVDSAMTDADDITVSSSSGILASSLTTGPVRHTIDLTEETDQRSYGTTRYACYVKFEFVHFTLPESSDLLKPLLYHRRIQSPAIHNLRAKAKQLLQLLSSGQSSVILIPDQISELGWRWLRKKVDVSNGSFDEDQPLRTWIFFETTFDQKSWHTRRRLTCISYLEPTTKILAEIAEDLDATISRFEGDVPKVYGDVVDALTSIRCLPSKVSAQAALQNWFLQLHVNPDTATCMWRFVTKEIIANFKPLFSSFEQEHISRLPGLCKRHVHTTETIPRPVQAEFLRSFGTHLKELSNPILLRKPAHWPVDTEDWCMLAVRGRDLTEWNSDGAILAHAIDSSHAYRVQKDYNVLDPCLYNLDRQSKRSLKKWKESLSVIETSSSESSSDTRSA